MRLPGFTAEAAAYARRVPFGMPALDVGHDRNHTVTMAVQCCPPGSNTTGCTTSAPRDCSTMRCPPGLVCCDCTFTHCTTPAECRRECLL